MTKRTLASAPKDRLAKLVTVEKKTFKTGTDQELLRSSLNLPVDLHWQAKAAAAMARLSFQEWIKEAVIEKLEKAKNKS